VRLHHQHFLRTGIMLTVNSLTKDLRTIFLEHGVSSLEAQVLLQQLLQLRGHVLLPLANRAGRSRSKFVLHLLFALRE
jgi:hypothetical protein